MLFAADEKKSLLFHANSAHYDEQKMPQIFFASAFTRDTFMMIIKCIIYTTRVNTAIFIVAIFIEHCCVITEL